jgi:tripartite-type tricarboxylate transporter receptor subunit TctC
MRRLSFLIASFSLCLALTSCTQHGEQKYPNRLIELIVPWAAGGGSDRVARFIADELQRRLGQPVVVVNRTGGSGAVGHSAGALAPPDGYTLTLATFELSTMQSMGISKLTWRDFTPVAQVNADAAAIFVRNDAPWKTLPELLDHIRKNPRKLKMSGTATGGAWDLARSGLLLAAGIPPSDVIWSPTQGAAPALVELLGNHVDIVCCSAAEAASQIESKQIRALAVLGPKRLAEFPAFPTAHEQTINYEAVGWRGIMLPKNTPPAVTERLATALEEICASDAFRKFMQKNGFAIEVRGPAEFAKFLEGEENKWGAVIKSAGYETLGSNHDPGPRAMPIILLAALGLALGGEAIAARKRAALPASESTRIPPNAIFLTIALILYLALMPRIGFIPTTFIFAATVMKRLGAKLWISVTASALLVAAIHLLFGVLFKVRLP